MSRRTPSARQASICGGTPRDTRVAHCVRPAGPLLPSQGGAAAPARTTAIVPPTLTRWWSSVTAGKSITRDARWKTTSAPANVARSAGTLVMSPWIVVTVGSGRPR